MITRSDINAAFKEYTVKRHLQLEATLAVQMPLIGEFSVRGGAVKVIKVRDVIFIRGMKGNNLQDRGPRREQSATSAQRRMTAASAALRIFTSMVSAAE